MQTKYVPMPTLKALAEANSCSTLGENRLRGAVTIAGRLYATTGTHWRGQSVLKVWGEEILPCESWTDEVLDASAISARLDDERRNNGTIYEGQGVQFHGQKYVMSGIRIEFCPQAGTVTTATKQLSLFAL